MVVIFFFLFCGTRNAVLTKNSHGSLNFFFQK
uniref:Uncharacterized protein n=1 Tax=viral metagenome TaxID=1070528 RepID=A0A6C0IDQ0_9ZZZZ